MCHLCKSTVNCLFPICVNDQLSQKEEEIKMESKEKKSKENEKLFE